MGLEARYKKTDEKMNFYTGVSTIKLFNAIFLIIAPYLPKLCYWRGPKRSMKVKSSKVRPHLKPHIAKILTCRDEFLLTLMRLRLGLLNEDLADLLEFHQQFVPTHLQHGSDY